MTSHISIPVADWIDHRALEADPYPTYERLRNESPVAYAPFVQMHVASTYGTCKLVETTPSLFVAGNEPSSSFRRTMTTPTMIDTNDPEHAANRRPVNARLRPKAVKERWTRAFEENTRFYLDQLAAAGPDAADLNAIASGLATKNLMDVLGIRGVDVGVVRNWSATLIGGLSNVAMDPEVWVTVDAVRDEVDALLDELIPYLRSNPDHTFTSALVAADRPVDSIKANVRLALSGGINEPQHAVTSIVWALSEHPDQRDDVLTHPELWPDVFEETLRWVSPVAISVRAAVEDVEVGGVTVPEGARVLCLLGSANRDESVFDDAASFDVRRPKTTHMAFGAGPHQCAGAWVARWSIGHIALPALYARFEGLRNAEDREAKWFGFFFRGLTDHPVTWNRDRGNS